MLDTREFLEETRRRLSTVRDRAMRRHKFAQIIARLPDSDACDVIEAVYLDAVLQQPPGRLLLENLAYLDDLEAALGRPRMAEMYRLSVETGYHFVGEILSPPAPEFPAVLPEGHRDLADLSLGEKKSLARRPSEVTIEKVMLEPNAGVIRILLNNPRTLLKHVLFIAARRPNYYQVLEQIFLHRKWSRHYEVRRALAGNPYTLPGIVIVTVPLLTSQDLERMEFGRNLNASLVQNTLALRRELLGDAPIRQRSDEDLADMERTADEHLLHLLEDERNKELVREFHLDMEPDSDPEPSDAN